MDCVFASVFLSLCVPLKAMGDHNSSVKGNAYDFMPKPGTYRWLHYECATFLHYAMFYLLIDVPLSRLVLKTTVTSVVLFYIENRFSQCIGCESMWLVLTSNDFCINWLMFR